MTLTSEDMSLAQCLEHGRRLARGRAPLTPDQVDTIARVAVQIDAHRHTADAAAPAPPA